MNVRALRARRPEVRRRAARIVVVGEDVETRHLVASALRSDGHEVVLASDGGQVFEHLGSLCLRHEKPDLFITDLSMAGWSGLDLIAMLRDAAWQTPVILLADLGSDALEVRGATAVVDKPVDLERLRAAVGAALGRRP